MTLKNWGFPDGPGVKNLLANAWETGSTPGLGRSHMLVYHNHWACSATRQATTMRSLALQWRVAPAHPN